VKNRFQSLPIKCNLQRYNEDFKLLCQKVLPFLGEEDLCAFTRGLLPAGAEVVHTGGIGGGGNNDDMRGHGRDALSRYRPRDDVEPKNTQPADARAAAAAAPFAGMAWRDEREAVLASALAVRGRAVVRLVEEGEAEGEAHAGEARRAIREALGFPPDDLPPDLPSNLPTASPPALPPASSPDSPPPVPPTDSPPPAPPTDYPPAPPTDSPPDSPKPPPEPMATEEAGAAAGEEEEEEGEAAAAAASEAEACEQHMALLRWAAAEVQAGRPEPGRTALLLQSWALRYALHTGEGGGGVAAMEHILRYNGVRFQRCGGGGSGVSGAGRDERGSKRRKGRESISGSSSDDDDSGDSESSDDDSDGGGGAGGRFAGGYSLVEKKKKRKKSKSQKKKRKSKKSRSSKRRRRVNAWDAIEPNADTLDDDDGGGTRSVVLPTDDYSTTWRVETDGFAMAWWGCTS
jgi:hypothetical protein